MGIENSVTVALIRKLATEAQQLLGLGLEKLEIDPAALPAVSSLAQLDLPVVPVAQLVQHLQGTNVSDALFPFARFGCVHAARVSIGWAQASKNSPKGRGALLGLAGYLIMACEWTNGGDCAEGKADEQGAATRSQACCSRRRRRGSSPPVRGRCT